MTEAAARMGWKLGSRREIKKIGEVLHHDETVKEMAGGSYAKRTGLLILTDQRLIFFNDGWTGSSHDDFSLSTVASVGYSGGMVTGKLKIHASGNTVDIESVIKRDAKRLVDAARLAILDAKSSPGQPVESPSTADPIEQIRKLGELKEAGVLTEEEFEAKKTALLGQI